MKTYKGSACAKVILFGEHSVVYGYPAIAAPLQNAILDCFIKKSDKFAVKASLEDDDKERIIEAVKTAMELLKIKEFPAELRIRSNFPTKAGLGSSAALSVAIVRALSKEGLSNDEVYSIAYEMEKIFHGNPSGIDNTVSAYKKTIYYIKGQKPEFIEIGQNFCLVVANTGDRALTRTVVAEVKERKKENPQKYEKIFENIGNITNEAREQLKKGNLERIGELMNRNQECLSQIGVSSTELDQLIAASLKSGALGAKLTGTGRGGCIIALAKNKNIAGIVKQLKPFSKAIIVSEIEKQKK